MPLHTGQNGHHKQSNKQQMLERLWRKGNPSALLVGLQTGAPLWKTVWNFLRKLKMELPFDSAIPLLGLYPKNPETPNHKNLLTPIFTAVQFTIAKCWKQPKCPSGNQWIKNCDTFTQWNSTQQKEEGTSTLSSSMDGTGEHYAK